MSEDIHTYARKRFERDTQHHTMRVLHDDGLYRHLLFRDPERSMYWYEIITWPGALTIRGDMGDYVFVRMVDMFEFFGLTGAGVNPQYWAEKVTAGTDRVMAYSEKKARQLVTEHVDQLAEGLSTGLAKAFRKAVDSEVLAHPEFDFQDGAAMLLRDFDWGRGDNRRTLVDILWDGWEPQEYTTHYLWCCHAIVHAIAQYEAAKVPA